MESLLVQSQEYLTGLTYTKVLLLFVGAHLLQKTVRSMHWNYHNRKLEAKARAIVEAKKAQRFEFKHIDPVKAEVILDMDLAQLRLGLLRGEFTSEDLVHVFAKRCYTIGRQLNLTAEECFDEAVEISRLRDKERHEAVKNGKGDELPLLHGIPISIKDMFEQKGYMSTLGTQFMTNKVYEEDGGIVKLLKDQGAIILVRGNTPQAAGAIHTTNRIWGDALNPYDHSRSCGGSTGGDAGLLAARCVPFSVGTDFGGSIRIPSSFCGVFGLKPTPWRMPEQGIRGALKDNFMAFTQIKVTVGPMGKSVNDLVIGFKTFQQANIHKRDIFTPPLPFKQESFDKALTGDHRIGYCFTLPTVEACLSMQNAIRMVKDTLEQKGFTMVPFTFTKEEVEEAKEIFIGLVAHFITLNVVKRLNDNYEKPMPGTQKLYNFFTMNPALQHVIRWIFSMKGNKRMAYNMRLFKPRTNDEIEGLMKRQVAFYKHIQGRFAQHNIDALVVPAYPITAFQAKNAGEVGGFFDYMAIFTITHFPVGVMPITEVLEGEDQRYDDGINDNWTEAIKNDIKGSKGMPVSVSIVGHAWEDETVLGVMKAIEEGIQFKKHPKY
eukprot:403368569